MKIRSAGIACASNFIQPGVISLRILCKAWRPAEDNSITEDYQAIGPSWALMARKLPGRSPAECRRRWLKLVVLPTLQTPVMLNLPAGPTDAKRRSLIEKIIKTAHEVGLRESPAFPSLTVMRPLTKAHLAEWNARMHGYEPIGSKWVLFPEEKRIPLPYEKIAAPLHARRLPRWRVLKQGWTELEDSVLREAYEHHGLDWISIHYALPKRTWQECRKRLTFLSLIWNPNTSISDSFPMTEECLPTLETKNMYTSDIN